MERASEIWKEINKIVKKENYHHRSKEEMAEAVKYYEEYGKDELKYLKYCNWDKERSSYRMMFKEKNVHGGKLVVVHCDTIQILKKVKAFLEEIRKIAHENQEIEFPYENVRQYVNRKRKRNFECEKDNDRKRNFECEKDNDNTVVIYNLIFIPENRPVYTGKTNDKDRRFQEHLSQNSKCRLVYDFIQKHGKENFRIHPILRCKKEDADMNESYFIIKMKTMYPEGLNLRHGSKAGVELSEHTLINYDEKCGFENLADELHAISEAWTDLSGICNYELCTLPEEETETNIDTAIKDLLRQVHPDKNPGKTFAAEEVCKMVLSLKKKMTNDDKL